MVITSPGLTGNVVVALAPSPPAPPVAPAPPCAPWATICSVETPPGTVYVWVPPVGPKTASGLSTFTVIVPVVESGSHVPWNVGLMQ